MQTHHVFINELSWFDDPCKAQHAIGPIFSDVFCMVFRAKTSARKAKKVDLHGRVPPLFVVIATISSRNEALDGRNLAQADPKLDTR